MKAYIIPHPSEGFNFYWTCPRGELIVKRGLEQNGVKLVDHPDEADYIFHTYVPHNKGIKCNDIISQYDPNKLVIIDWIDEQYIMYDKFHRYFKRSMVDGDCTRICARKKLRQYPANVFPFAYAILEEFCLPTRYKDINYGCYLRYTCPNRNYMLEVTGQLYKFGLTHGALGEVNQSSRSISGQVYFDHSYLEYLSRTRMVITCNPTGWEGDSRLWEALANKCLVFVDEMFVPYHNKLIGGTHLVEYSLNNIQDFVSKIVYYNKYTKEANEIAEAGYQYAMEHHTAKARMKYVLEQL